MPGALARTSSQYDRVLKVLNWVSPEKHNVVLGLNMKKRFHAICDIAQFTPSLSAEDEAKALIIAEEARVATESKANAERAAKDVTGS